MAQVAIPGNPAQTYDLTVGVMLDVEDMIHMISPSDVPIQGGQGAGGTSLITTGTCFEKKVEWLDEELLLPVSAAGAAATSTSTNIQVASGHQNRFSTGDVIAFGTEKALVTGYGTTDILTVTRGFASSTAQTLTATAPATVIRVIGQALLEGSDPEAARWQDRANRVNYTQIFGPTAVQVTGTENVVRKYGLSSTTEFEKQAANRIKEQYIQLEQALMYGKQLEGANGATAYRTMSGLTEFISTNIDSSTGSITEALLLAQHQAAYEAGGNPDILIVSPKQKRVFSAVNTGPPAVTVQTSRVDDGRGTVISYYDSDFGRLTIVMSRWCNIADVFGYNRDQWEVTTLRPMQFEMLAKTGDSMKGQIVCEKTSKFRRQQHAFRFSALT